MAIILARVEGVSALMFARCPHCGTSVEWDEPLRDGQGRWTMNGRCRCRAPRRKSTDRISFGLWDVD